MARHRSAENFTVNELRQLLLEKRRRERLARIRNFSRTTSAAQPRQRQPERRPARKSSRFFNGLLLAVELAAAAGLVLVLFGAYSLLRQIDRAAAAFNLPTLTQPYTPAFVQPTETSLRLPAVLPSGHRPPAAPRPAVTAAETAQPEPTPQPTVQPTALPAVLPTAAPPGGSGSSPAVRIRIPMISVDAPVLQGDDLVTLRDGVGQSQINPVNPGQAGNLVLSAHNDIFGEIFRDLDQLEPGAEILVLAGEEEYRYQVDEIQVVTPDQVHWIGPTEDPVITLVSCYPYLIDTHRIIVRGSFLPALSQ